MAEKRSKDAPDYRDKLMREIAALHARMARGFYKDDRPKMADTERAKLLRRIAKLEKKLMDS